MKTPLPSHRVILLMLGCCLLFGQPLPAQELAANRLKTNSARPVNKQPESRRLIDVLDQLADRFSVTFDYDLTMLEDKRVLTLPEAEVPGDIDQVLKKILLPHRLRYEKLYDKSYLILEEAAQPKLEKKSATALLGPWTPPRPEANRQLRIENVNLRQRAEKTITGQVTDLSTGETLPGVNIVVKNTTIGTVTDIDGNYRLTVPDDAQALVFSSVGYTSEEVAIDNRTVINLEMAPDIQSLSEVVVVGYGTVQKSDLTGSVSQITNEDFNIGVNTSVDQAISGRVPGVQIRQTSGEPGGGISVRIRGASSINAGNEPLYVIDGLPIDNGTTLSTGGGAGTGGNPNPKNPLNSLNPNDIQSIEVLKDASATAIYGSRGANGVIMITTKSGKSGKMSVSLDQYTGIQTVDKKYDILDTKQYIETINALAQENGNDLVFPENSIDSIGNGTDWQDEMYRAAIVQNYGLSFTGGSDKLNYYISGNYLNQDGIIKSSGIKQYTLKTNFASKLNERLDLNLNLNTSLVKDQAAVIGTATNENAGIIYSSVFYDPTEMIKDQNGDFTTSTNLLLNNPVTIYEGIDNSLKTNRVFGNFTLNYQLTDALSAKINLGGDQQIIRRDIYNSRITLQGKANNGLAQISSLDRSNVLAEYTMNFSKDIIENQFIDVLVGITYQDFVDRSFSAGISDFPTDVLLTDNLSFGNSDQAVVSSSKNGYTLLSYLGRINYNLFDKFLFSGAIRADGSSRFGENNKFGYFPSAALAWKIGQEDFIPSLFSELKLRTSWGITGNQAIPSYNSLSTYVTTGSAIFNGTPFTASSPSRLSNPNLKWETTEQINVGIDFGILEDRITGSLDYFHKNTRDMLINVPLPLSSGYGSVLRNIGEMRNYGFEMLINSNNVVGKNFRWNTTLNFSAIKNEVLDIGDNIDRILMGQVPDALENGTIVIPGQPLNSYFGFNITGIFQSQGEIDNSAQPNSQPGFPIFEDVNGDNQINSDDRIILGNPFPDFTFGISNSFGYKNFTLDIQINGQYGNELLNGTEVALMYPTNFRRNRSVPQINNRWTTENPDARWPSGTNPTAYGGGKVSNLVISDASYIRLQSLRLGYNISTQNISFLEKASIYFIGQNLLTLTNYSGVNPDASVYGRSNSQIDFMSYPLAKIWTLGINLTF